MDTRWETVESGPEDAQHTVLLRPGGMCSARSYAEVMAEPSLAQTRLLAVTMPGHAGAPPPADYIVESASDYKRPCAGCTATTTPRGGSAKPVCLRGS